MDPYDPIWSQKVRNGPKSFEMVRNGLKWSEIVQNDPKWSHGHKWSHMIPNGSKWSEMVRNGPKWSEVVPNGPKLSQIFLKGPKRFKCSKWFQLAPMSIMTCICVLVFLKACSVWKKNHLKSYFDLMWKLNGKLPIDSLVLNNTFFDFFTSTFLSSAKLMN